MFESFVSSIIIRVQFVTKSPRGEDGVRVIFTLRYTLFEGPDYVSGRSVEIEV